MSSRCSTLTTDTRRRRVDPAVCRVPPPRSPSLPAGVLNRRLGLRRLARPSPIGFPTVRRSRRPGRRRTGCRHRRCDERDALAAEPRRGASPGSTVYVGVVGAAEISRAAQGVVRRVSRRFDMTPETWPAVTTLRRGPGGSTGTSRGRSGQKRRRVSGHRYDCDRLDSVAEQHAREQPVSAWVARWNN